jgi:hypothetical protein
MDKEDIEELRQLLAKATRPNIKKILQEKLHLLESQAKLQKPTTDQTETREGQISDEGESNFQKDSQKSLLSDSKPSTSNHHSVPTNFATSTKLEVKKYDWSQNEDSIV